MGAGGDVWGDRLPLLRAFLLEADSVACDWPGSYIQWGFPLQHHGGGLHLRHPHIIWRACGEGNVARDVGLFSQVAATPQPSSQTGGQRVVQVSV